MDNHSRGDFARSAPYWLRRTGVVSWLFLGVVLAATTIVSAVAAVSGIAVPLLVAALIGVLFQPLVDMLEKQRVPRLIGTILTMVLIILGAVGMVSLVVQGFIQQGPEIAGQLQAGWLELRAWLLQFDIDVTTVEAIRTAIANGLPKLGQGVMGFLGSTFSSVAAMLVGLFFGLFILFFILRDGPEIDAWLARQLGVSPETGTAIVADARRSLRLYFRGTAITAASTSIIVLIPLVILKVPLLVPILVLYFFTSFIPYVGAFIGGFFAVLIAFSSGGAQTALIILVAVLISNGAIQSAVSSWALGSSLKLHPLAVFLVTTAAGVVGGALAMMLAAPLAATAVETAARLRAEGIFTED